MLINTFRLGVYLMKRPRTIYQYSYMALRFSGQTSSFGGAFFMSKYLLGIEGRRIKQICNFDLKRLGAMLEL